MVFSAFLALTLTPALCATFLKPVSAHAETPRLLRPVSIGASSAPLTATRAWWRGFCGTPGVGWWCFGVVVAAVGWMYTRLPSSFLPNEDQGYLIVNVQLPPGATVGPDPRP